MAKNLAKLSGDKELLNVIFKLPNASSQKRVWQSLARSAANPIVKKVRTLVPVDSGDLKRSVKYRNFSSNTLGGRGGYVKFNHRSKSKNFTNPAKAQVLVHNRKNKPLHNTDKNYITEAAKVTKSQSMALMERRALKFLDREIKKLL